MGITHVYGDISNKTGIKQLFEKIREAVENANSREDLTNLYSRAGYLITLTHATEWEEKFGDELNELRDLAEAEFSKTARKINTQARQIGAGDNYDETWGD